MKMNALRITQEVYETYQREVKGNENISYDQACRKLTRNMLLAKEFPQRTDYDRLSGNKLYYYGNLKMIVRNHTIIHIENTPSRVAGWRFDQERYEQLTEDLGIEEGSKFQAS